MTITIDEAIKDLRELAPTLVGRRYGKAIKLGIEALERVTELRNQWVLMPRRDIIDAIQELLPSEEAE